MNTCREYGNPPYRVIVLHGGPGAPGCCAGICRGLAPSFGVLEHLQRASSIDGLILELEEIIQHYELGQMVLIGHSFGAWLAYLFAARRPELVKKLLLVGCGPFEVKYLDQLKRARWAKFTPEEQRALDEAIAQMDSGAEMDPEKKTLFLRLIDADHHCLRSDLEPDQSTFNETQHRALMNEFMPMRESGELLESACFIRCPVVAIHGRQDPHPWEGVGVPLKERLSDFRMILLDQCGHEPWRERYAHEEFFEVLRSEIDELSAF